MFTQALIASILQDDQKIISLQILMNRKTLYKDKAMIISTAKNAV